MTWREPAPLAVIVQCLVHAATERQPALRTRLERAGVIVLTGGVTEADGQHLVTSQSNVGRVYHVNGTCDCEDYTAPQGLCKHRLAMRLFVKATTMQREQRALCDAARQAQDDMQLAQSVYASARAAYENGARYHLDLCYLAQELTDVSSFEEVVNAEEEAAQAT